MIKKLIETPFIVFALITAISFSALAAAFIAEGLLGLEPCRLCIIQRYPFAFGVFCGLIGLAVHQKRKTSIGLIILCGVGYVFNSAVALYHTGVEQHWWKSTVSGCEVTFDDSDSNKSILENIMSAPMGDCSQIPWQDPILGLSMANWNIPFCFGLFAFCLLAAFSIIRKPSESPSS